MKFGWLLVFALGAAVAIPASAQVSVYGDFSASKLTGGLTTQTTTVLYGPTIGLTARIAGNKHLNLSGDLRSGFYHHSAGLDELAVGPKLGLGIKKFEVYSEVLVGFGRYHDNNNAASTDAQMEVNIGLDWKRSGPIDWRVFEYGYQQFYGLGGEFNPKTFSTGLVVHLGKR
jgi:hypothetical protein